MMIAVKVIVLAALIAGCHCVDLIIRNNEIGPIWIGVLGNPGQPSPHKGGVIVESFTNATVTVPADWSGTIWPRTWCYPDTQVCDTGDCGKGLECDGASGNTPYTRVEINLKGDKGNDFYEVSLVDGFNLKASIEPLDYHGRAGGKRCQRVKCDNYINDECPDDLRLIGPHASFTIACKSACVALKTDEYCCQNKYNGKEKCKSKDFPVNYPAFFKKRCPDARSYKYDERTKVPRCNADKYLIIFG